MNNETMNRTQAAAYVGCHRLVLERLAKRHEGPAFTKYSRASIRYSKADLDAWLQSIRHDPKSNPTD